MTGLECWLQRHEWAFGKSCGIINFCIYIIAQISELPRKLYGRCFLGNGMEMTIKRNGDSPVLWGHSSAENGMWALLYRKHFSVIEISSWYRSALISIQMRDIPLPQSSALLQRSVLISIQMRDIPLPQRNVLLQRSVTISIQMRDIPLPQRNVPLQRSVTIPCTTKRTDINRPQQGSWSVPPEAWSKEQLSLSAGQRLTAMFSYSL